MKKITLIATLFLAFASYAQVVTVASTSFEEEVIEAGVNDAQYVDTGDANVAHDLVNNPLQTPVDQSGGTELGIDARYVPYDEPGTGLTDGDFVGVTSFTGTVGDFTDGLQGYQFQDADGNMIAEFDVVDLTNSVSNSVSIDYFIQETGWEGDGTVNDSSNDRIKIYVKDLTNGVDIDILNTEGSDIDDLVIEDVWTTGTLALPDNIMMQLVVELRSNSGSEAVFIDNIIIEGESTLAVNDEVNNPFSIYPNPTNQKFISIDSSLDGDKTIVLFDILGKEVLNTTISNNKLNISSFLSGVYFIKINQGDKSSTQKLIIK